jgi:GNAT superfamily N-acetyltransferase
MRIRTARSTDIDAIVAFTTDTFSWGDYVPSMISQWIADDQGTVMVAVDDDDAAIAMARAVFLTDAEVWSHAARVHPSHRGQGIAGDLALVQMDWARSEGATVVRLLIEDGNEASIRHIQKIGFHRTTTAIRATRPVDSVVESTVSLHEGTEPDAAVLMSSWSTSESGRALHGLVATGWRFHHLRSADVEKAIESDELWEFGSSWAMVGPVAPSFEVRLVDTQQDEADMVLAALATTARDSGAESMTLWLADLGWAIAAARQAGCEVASHGIWEHPL